MRALRAGGIAIAEDDGTADAGAPGAPAPGRRSERPRASQRGPAVRGLAGAPDVARVAESERLLGRFGEVEFAAFDVGTAIDDRHADRAPAIV